MGPKTVTATSEMLARGVNTYQAPTMISNIAVATMSMRGRKKVATSG